jgi:CheY-like chemotaxis protein
MGGWVDGWMGHISSFWMGNPSGMHLLNPSQTERESLSTVNCQLPTHCPLPSMHSPLPANDSALVPIESPPFVILVVEDSHEDYEALRRCFRHSAVGGASVVQNRVKLERCETGKEALDYLDRCIAAAEPDRSPAIPDLILLDLNLPGINGHRVLQSIKQNPQLKHIPTVVLTTSNNPRDIEDCYRLGSNSYLLKAMEFKRFKQTIDTTIAYWFDTVILPNRR